MIELRRNRDIPRQLPDPARPGRGTGCWNQGTSPTAAIAPMRQPPTRRPPERSQDVAEESQKKKKKRKEETKKNDRTQMPDDFLYWNGHSPEAALWSGIDEGATVEERVLIVMDRTGAFYTETKRRGQPECGFVRRPWNRPRTRQGTRAPRPNTRWNTHWNPLKVDHRETLLDSCRRCLLVALYCCCFSLSPIHTGRPPKTIECAVPPQSVAGGWP